MRFLIILWMPMAIAGTADYSTARNKAMQALYNQTGLEDQVNLYAKTLDERYVPDYVHANGAPFLILVDVFVRREIQWKWTF